MFKINYLDASEANINALKKAAGITTSEGFSYEDPEKELTYTEEQEQEVTPIISGSSDSIIVKVVSKANDLYYNVIVYPYGINGPGSYSAQLFFGDKAWNAEIPVNTYLVANSISVIQVQGE